MSCPHWNYVKTKLPLLIKQIVSFFSDSFRYLQSTSLVGFNSRGCGRTEEGWERKMKNELIEKERKLNEKKEKLRENLQNPNLWRNILVKWLARLCLLLHTKTSSNSHLSFESNCLFSSSKMKQQNLFELFSTFLSKNFASNHCLIHSFMKAFRKPWLGLRITLNSFPCFYICVITIHTWVFR